MHQWGEEDFDWRGLDDAISIIVKNLRFWRVGVRQAKEKYGCYDEKTMVLTKNGFKYFKDVNIETDEFATLQKDSYLQYYKASSYVEYKHKGKMYSLKTRGVDLLVTENHNLYVAKGDICGGKNNIGHKKFSFMLENYKRLFRKAKNFKKGAMWIGNTSDKFILPEYSNTWNNGKCIRKFKDETKTINMKYWVMFLGWYIAEGNSDGCQVTLSLNGNNKEEITSVSNILDKINMKHTVYLNKSKCSINIYSKQLGLWLRNNCGGGAHNKKVPSFIKELSPRLIKYFLDCLYLGDGYKSKTANNLYTVSEILAYDVMELLLKCGYCGALYKEPKKESVYKDRIIKSKHQCFRINWLKKTIHRTINSHDSLKKINEKEKIVDYDGNIYCVTVPGHILYVIRNGKSCWCGNTVRIYCFLGWDSLHSITHPGHCFNRYPKWLWNLDCDYLSKIVSRFNWLVVPIHKWAYRRAYKKAVDIYPHLKEEICSMADYVDLLDFYESRWMKI